MGGELGHISRLSAIAEALKTRGFDVTVMLKDLSRSHDFFAPLGITVIQAPVWLPKMHMQRPIACLADSLLLMGYLEEQGLTSLVTAWQAQIQLIQPDLVILDYSPTALLALREVPLPKLSVGTGFADPVPGQPIADWRPHPQSDQLIARQEQRVLQVINKVLVGQGKGLLTGLSELFTVDKVFISNFPQLDLYRAVRKDAVYCPASDTPLRGAPCWPTAVAPGPRILAYLKPGYPQLQQLVTALAACSASVWIICPKGDLACLKGWASESVEITTGLVNMAEALTQADLFVCHGNGSTVKESLYAGVPSVVLPLQLEQLLIGLRLQSLGLASLVERIEETSRLTRLIDSMLHTDQYHQAVQKFIRASEGELFVTATPLAEKVREACIQYLGDPNSGPER